MIKSHLCVRPNRRIASLLALFALPLATLAAEPSFDNLTNWSIYRGDSKGVQYSELSQIHAANVADLEPAWVYHSGDAKQGTKQG